MSNIKLTIEFDGTGYEGWQAQPDGKTIQDEIEKCIMVLTKERVRVHSSGRTDAGVHARKMIVNFHDGFDLDLKKFKKSMNALLPDDISVLKAESAEREFHSRKSAKRKIYEYHILNREEKSVFLKRYAWHVRKPLDITKMIEASGYLIGEHDFTSFASVGSDVKSNVRTIYGIDVKRDGDMVIITCEGNGFLKQMVRNVTGLLVQVGLGRFDPPYAEEILDKKVKEKPYVTAPAKGLFLLDVLY